ncbi:probable BOI-related E3 ubiquitin-protein ligase 3 [Nymphaea colorata]|nr:probable BOI-related E3 ubiquitin-protein ligase 3 [Nymphaea colorata]
MFLQPFEAPTNSLMAEIASRNFVNPIAGGFPLQEGQNFSSNFSPFILQGVSPIVENPADDFSCGFSASRKRGRDEFRSVFDREILVKVQRQCQELDRFVALQTEKTRAELEEKRRSYWRQVVAAAEVGMQRILRGKDEEIESMNRRNSALEEKVRALLVEGQVWRNLAQANEATVVALRRDLELLLLSNANADGNNNAKAPSSLEEGQGDNGECCSYGEAADKDAAAKSGCDGGGGVGEVEADEQKGRRRRVMGCKVCGTREVSVLVLPCRHLCLCSECDGRSEKCPLCFSPKTATVQVYMS